VRKGFVVLYKHITKIWCIYNGENLQIIMEKECEKDGEREREREALWRASVNSLTLTRKWADWDGQRANGEKKEIHFQVLGSVSKMMATMKFK
jgi:hypothetical protein